MRNEEVMQYITSIHPLATYDETGEWLNIVVQASEWKSIATQLRTGPLHLDYLFCLTCIDWKTHLTMVYHFTSTRHRHTIVIKTNLDRIVPAIETVSDLWKTANFHEREVSELFGVDFIDHPDLRKLILTDDFVGYPLRKDFEDPINMIKL